MPEPALPPTPRRVGIMAEMTGAASLKPLVDAALNRLALHGFETLVVSSGDSVREERSAWEVLAHSDCSGLIVHSDCLDNDQLHGLISTRPNVVLVNLNDTQVGKLAAAHFLRRGHREVAMVTGPLHRCCMRHTLDGFVQQFRKSRSSGTDVLTLESELTEEGGANAMRKIILSEASPTAVFFHHDVMAIGALRVCRQEGVRVPDEISVLGCGDLVAAAHARPALCTIQRPLKQIGEQAAMRVLHQIDRGTSGPDLEGELVSSNPEIITGYTVRDRSKTSQELADSQISSRERECLQWAANGKTSWEISQILGVTESTIIYHLRNATRKLDAANRLHAVVKALKASIIDF